MTKGGYVDVLIVAGGGGGSGSNSDAGGGGGGAGELKMGSVEVTPGDYTITIGTGGNAGAANANGNTGNASNAFGFTSATILADMAGKSNRVTGKTKITKRYAYSRAKSGFRTHRINGQGENMIRALNAKANASRFVWPGAEKSLPAVREEFQTVVDDVVLRVNAELERKNGL